MSMDYEKRITTTKKAHNNTTKMQQTTLLDMKISEKQILRKIK